MFFIELFCLDMLFFWVFSNDNFFLVILVDLVFWMISVILLIFKYFLFIGFIVGMDFVGS